MLTTCIPSNNNTSEIFILVLNHPCTSSATLAGTTVTVSTLHVTQYVIKTFFILRPRLGIKKLKGNQQANTVHFIVNYMA